MREQQMQEPSGVHVEGPSVAMILAPLRVSLLVCIDEGKDPQQWLV
jgi:hypothetical protein